MVVICIKILSYVTNGVKCIKGTQDVSVLSLTTAYKSKIIQIKSILRSKTLENKQMAYLGQPFHLILNKSRPEGFNAFPSVTKLGSNRIRTANP